MKKTKLCPICKKEMDAPTVDVCTAAYSYLLERIKKDHPEWVEKDGACPKCVEYYKELP